MLSPLLQKQGAQERHCEKAGAMEDHMWMDQFLLTPSCVKWADISDCAVFKYQHIGSGRPHEWLLCKPSWDLSPRKSMDIGNNKMPKMEPPVKTWESPYG